MARTGLRCRDVPMRYVRRVNSPADASTKDQIQQINGRRCKHRHEMGNNGTLNKRRTHLIGTSLHRNHLRTFIGIHTKNTRNVSRMFPGTPMLLQCTDAPPMNGGKTEPCRAHRLGASDRVICVRQVIPDAIFSSAREQPDLPGQRPCPVRGRREGATAGFPPWRGRP